MSALMLRVARRLAWTAGSLSLLDWALSRPEVADLAPNAQDGLLFFLAAAMFAAILPRAVRFYTAPVISSSHLISLAMSVLAMGFVVSTMSSVHIRAAGYIVALYDGPTRVAFRNDYIAFAAVILLTAGAYEPDVFRSAAAARWRRLACVVGASIAILATLSCADRATLWLRTRQEMHDTAPGAPDADGIP